MMAKVHQSLQLFNQLLGSFSLLFQTFIQAAHFYKIKKILTQTLRDKLNCTFCILQYNSVLLPNEKSCVQRIHGHFEGGIKLQQHSSQNQVLYYDFLKVLLYSNYSNQYTYLFVYCQLFVYILEVICVPSCYLGWVFLRNWNHPLLSHNTEVPNYQSYSCMYIGYYEMTVYLH